MASNMPHWLPSILFIAAFLSVAVAISFHPRFRNMYRARPAAPGRPNLFQSRSRGPGVMSTDVAGLLHYKPMIGAWIGIVSWCVLLALVAPLLPLPIAVTAAPILLLFAVLGYLRPRGAVQSCYVDQNGITLIRRDVTIPFDPNQFRCIRMYCTESDAVTYPSMLVLYRDTQPSLVTWIASILFPRVDDRRVVLFFNRWRDADGYLVGPHDMAALFYQACVRAGRTPTEKDRFFGASGWEVGNETTPF
jgi:hypothetical protein